MWSTPASVAQRVSLLPSIRFDVAMFMWDDEEEENDEIVIDIVVHLFLIRRRVYHLFIYIHKRIPGSGVWEGEGTPAEFSCVIKTVHKIRYYNKANVNSHMEILSDHCACEHREGPHQHASQSGKLESDIENLSPLTTLPPLMITPVSASTIRLKLPSFIPPQCYLLLFTRSLWCLFPAHSRLKCADILSDQLKFFPPSITSCLRVDPNLFLGTDYTLTDPRKNTRALRLRPPGIPASQSCSSDWFCLYEHLGGSESCHQVRAWHFDSLPPAHRNSSQAALLPTRDVIAISFRVMHWSTEVSRCKQISCSCTLCDRKGVF